LGEFQSHANFVKKDLRFVNFAKLKKNYLELIEKLICVFTDIEIEIFIQVQTRCLVKEEEEEKNNLFLLSTQSKTLRRRFCNVLRVKNIEEIPAFVS
jgi:hypothetical protein